jgi:hypothetical protein
MRIKNYIDLQRNKIGELIDKNNIIKAKEHRIGDVFNINGGNSGLIEEFIYLNQPISKFNV